jgi:hypothetical protein
MGVMAYVVAVVVLLVMLCSCTRQVYVPVESVRTEYRDREIYKAVTDTVRDTRIVWLKGDTVIDVREKERVLRVEVRDTCYVQLTDTIREPYPVEKPLSKWQQVKMDFGGMAIGAIAIMIGFAVVWIARRFF